MANSLSPAAQEIWVAYLEHSEADETPADLPALAAALRAAADQVVPPEREKEFYDRNQSLTLQKAAEIRAELLAIAAELEGGGTNTIQKD